MEIDLVNDTITPITDETFKKQGWERNYLEKDEEVYNWSLPLPKDNPDSMSPILISTVNTDWEYLEIPEGTYTVSIYDFNGLGHCIYEEDIEDLYSVLTKEDIYDDNLSPDTDKVSEE